MVRTVAAWSGKTEVVKLEFDPRVIDYATLAKRAAAENCASVALPLTKAQEKIARLYFGDAIEPGKLDIRVVADTKYYLRGTKLKHVPMTPAQAAAVNADVTAARTSDLLSPRQKTLLEFIEKHPTLDWPDVVDRDIVESWKQVEAMVAKARVSKVNAPRE